MGVMIPANIEPLLPRLCRVGEARLVEVVVRDWVKQAGEPWRIECARILTERDDAVYDRLAVEVVKCMSAAEEAEFCREAGRIGAELEAYLAGSKRRETLRTLLGRENLREATLVKLSRTKSAEIGETAAGLLIKDLEERKAATGKVGVETIARWSRQGPAYAEWLVGESGIDPVERGWRLDQYLPVGELGAASKRHLAEILATSTNLPEEQRRGIERWMANVRTDGEINAIVAAAFGKGQAAELWGYVKANLVTEVEAGAETWGTYRRLLAAIGKHSLEKIMGLEWGDGETLGVALAHPHTRPYALKSGLLTGEELEAEVARSLAGGAETGRDVWALCVNPNLPMETVEQLAALVGDRGVYALYPARLSDRTRARLMARNPEYVETLVLTYVMSKKGGEVSSHLGAWFTEAVCAEYARLVGAGEVATGTEMVYVRWANAVLESTEAVREEVLAAVRMDHAIDGRVAEEMAALIAEAKADPETLTGLLERWRGTVMTMVTAAGKL
jgi:hypothetical protein